MHFTDSVQAGRDLCTDIGLRVSQTIKSLVNGEAPEYIVDVTDTERVERDCYPDGLSSSSSSSSSSSGSSRSGSSSSSHSSSKSSSRD